MLEESLCVLKVNESRYIALHYLWSEDLWKRFSQMILSIFPFLNQKFYLFSIFFVIDLKVWGNPTWLISWFINFKIVQYTEFNHFFSINVNVTLCSFANGFRFCLKISNSDYSFSGFECFDYWWQMFVESTGCFRFSHRGFEGRCICAYG